MLHASTQQLIRKLHELTEAGGLAWQEGEQGSSRLETEGYVVEIAEAPPAFRLLRGDGRELEKAAAEDLAAVAWPGGDGSTYATRVAEMAARANRIARGAEQAIATILSSLSAPAKKPAPPPAAPPAPTSTAPAQIANPAQPAAPPAAAAQRPAEPPPPLPPPKPAPTTLTQGLSAWTVQSVEQSSPADLQRVVVTPKPAAPSPATGPNIYKPWS